MPFVQVSAIAQDSKGFLWTGGYGGLSRFDGLDFKNYSKLDGLTSTTVNALSVDYAGRLWVGTPKGINWIYNDQIHALPDCKVPIHQIVQADSSILLLSDSSVIVAKDSIKIYEINTPSTIASNSIALWNDTLWLGNIKGLWYATKPFERFNQVDKWADVMVYSLQSSDSCLSIGHEKGLTIWEPNSKKDITWKDGLLGGRVLKAYRSETNEWWAFTDLGTNIIHRTANQFTFKLAQIGSSNQNRVIHTFFTDSENNLWIGTSHGLFRSGGNAFRNYSYTDGLNASFVFEVTKDHEGNYWLGTRDQGVFKYNGRSFIAYNTSHGLLSDEAKTILCVRDSTLIGSEKGLNLFHKGVMKSYPASNMPISSVNDILALKDGSIMLGGDGGVAFFPNIAASFMPLPKNNKADIWKLFEDSNENVWIGTYQGGMFLLPKDSDTLIDVFSEWDAPYETALAITEDSIGRIWIGTFEGVLCHDPNSDTTYHITSDDGLNSNLIYTLEYDHKTNTTWAGTNQGINQISFSPDTEDQLSILSFGSDEGFSGVECNSHGCYIDEDGTLWFGTVNGLITFNQNLYKPNKQENHLHISTTRLFYKDTLISNHSIFPYNENHLTFEFEGICLTNPKKVGYRYRLKGLTEEWSPTTSINQATYSNLDPGKYTFEVISKNNSGIWNSEPAQFHFTIKPPFWDTLLFKVLTAIGIVFLLAGLISYRLNRLQQKNSLARKIDQMKLQALRAQMNPHFIFNSLNSIQHFINANEPREANRYLSKFAKLMRLMLDNSRRDAIPLDDDVAALQLYLELEVLRFEDAFEYQIELNSEIDRQDIEVPPMLIQPFVENAILHAFTGLKKKGKISIKFDLEDSHIKCIVQDNGIGRQEARKIKEKSKKRFHRSSGIHIIEDRLNTLNEYHKEQLVVHVEDLYDNGTPSGTRVLIRIPIIELTKPQ